MTGQEYPREPPMTAITFSDQIHAAIRSTAPGYMQATHQDFAQFDMSRGEARFTWPAEVLAAMPDPRGEDLRYQDPRGSAALREAFLAHRAIRSQPGLDPRQLLVTAGAKQALWLAFAVAVRAGDRILLPCPGWAPYRIWAGAFGARASFYDPSPLHADALLAEIAARNCDHVVINSPHNPPGAEYDQAIIDRIAAAAAAAGVTVISDEVYRDLGRDRASFLAHIGTPGGVMVADSLSKTAGAAGLRIGFLAGPADVVDAALAVRATIDSCPPGTGQAIATFLLSPAAAPLRHGIRQFAQASVARLAEKLRALGTPAESSGALYLWVPASGDGDCVALGDGMLARGVAGRTFGLGGHVRLCPVDSDERIARLLGVAFEPGGEA